jgi:hypothetical protein
MRLRASKQRRNSVFLWAERLTASPSCPSSSKALPPIKWADNR